MFASPYLPERSSGSLLKRSFGLHILSSLVVCVILAGCAVSPPVQEMSDARQAIKAARDARADRFAPDALNSAKNHLDRASSRLEEGSYDQAREAALFAKREAVRARDMAVHSGGEM